MTNIRSIESVGAHQTYDLEVNHPDHQFYLANGILTSNSHSVAYALDSYYAAWLHTHYEKEWLATILQSASSNPKELSKVVSEIKSLGYRFTKHDVNFSGMEWQYSEEAQAFVPPLGSVKGIGGAAVEEILKNRPYKNLHDMLYDGDGSWRHSKVNKTVLTALCKTEALESLEDFQSGGVSNHKQLLMALTGDDNYDTLRKGIYGLTPAQIKKKQKDGDNLSPFIDDVLASLESEADWARDEKIAMCYDLTSSVDMDLLFPPDIMRKIADKEIPKIHDVPPGEEGIGWFCVSEFETKNTKNGKTFTRIKAIDNESRSVWLRVWGSFNEPIRPYTIWVGQASHDAKWGFSTSVFKLRQII